jgi:hypothetical protein
MASVVGSSCLKRGVNSHIGIFKRYFNMSLLSKKSRFFYVLKFSLNKI